MTQLDLRYNLKDILRESGMTQLELAKKINISPTNLNTRLARGRNCQLSLLESICKALDVDIELLMYGTAGATAPDKLEEEEMYRLKYEQLQIEFIEALKEISNLKDEVLKKVAPAQKKQARE